MKDAAVRKIKQEIAIKKKHIEVYNSYMRMAVERRDLHGGNKRTRISSKFHRTIKRSS
mgnify:CR=1 FL=1